MMEVDDDFVERSNTFMNWLQSSGAKLSDNIEIADLRQQHAGRGVGTDFLIIQYMESETNLS
jgi:hypothetical protein